MGPSEPRSSAAPATDSRNRRLRRTARGTCRLGNQATEVTDVVALQLLAGSTATVFGS